MEAGVMGPVVVAVVAVILVEETGTYGEELPVASDAERRCGCIVYLAVAPSITGFDANVTLRPLRLPAPVGVVVIEVTGVLLLGSFRIKCPVLVGEGMGTAYVRRTEALAAAAE